MSGEGIPPLPQSVGSCGICGCRKALLRSGHRANRVTPTTIPHSHPPSTRLCAASIARRTERSLSPVLAAISSKVRPSCRRRTIGPPGGDRPASSCPSTSAWARTGWATGRRPAGLAGHPLARRSKRLLAAEVELVGVGPPPGKTSTTLFLATRPDSCGNDRRGEIRVHASAGEDALPDRLDEVHRVESRSQGPRTAERTMIRTSDSKVRKSSAVAASYPPGALAKS